MRTYSLKLASGFIDTFSYRYTDIRQANIMGSKRKRKNKNHTLKNSSVKKKTFNWKKLAKRASIFLCLVALISIPLYFSSNQSRIEHDLSVIGNGRTPTVVQIHDPNCQLCNQLKRNVAAVKGEFKGKIEFKIANIKTNKGGRFAQRYNVPHVTLLFFDRKGNRVNTLQGVSSQKDIQQALSSLVASR